MCGAGKEVPVQHVRRETSPRHLKEGKHREKTPDAGKVRKGKMKTALDAIRKKRKHLEREVCNAGLLRTQHASEREEADSAIGKSRMNLATKKSDLLFLDGSCARARDKHARTGGNSHVYSTQKKAAAGEGAENGPPIGGYAPSGGRKG